MALIKCDECGKDVSSKAKSCPNCGNPISTKQFDRVCEKCGGYVYDDATTCVHCGKKLTSLNYVERKKKNTMSMVGFIFGGISLFIDIAGILGILAVVFSCIGSVQIKNNNESGMAYAIFGFILGFISIGYTVYRLVEYQQTIQVFFG